MNHAKSDTALPIFSWLARFQPPLCLFSAQKHHSSPPSRTRCAHSFRWDADGHKKAAPKSDSYTLRARNRLRRWSESGRNMLGIAAPDITWQKGMSYHKNSLIWSVKLSPHQSLRSISLQAHQSALSEKLRNSVWRNWMINYNLIIAISDKPL